MSEAPRNLADLKLPVTSLFGPLNETIVESIVGRVLESRKNLPRGVCQDLEMALDENVKVHGFRSASVAPTHRILKPVCQMAQSSHQLAVSILHAWYETEAELREAVKAQLESLEVTIREPNLFDEPLEAAPKGLPPDEPSNFPALLERLCQLGAPQWVVNHHRVSNAHQVIVKSKSNRGYETSLMVQLLTGVALVENYADMAQYFVKREDQEDFRSILTETLSVLSQFPATSPEWDDVIPQFAESLASLIETKRADRETVSTLISVLSVMEQHHENLLHFFSCDYRSWTLESIDASFTYQHVHERASLLKELLDQYAPLHERASSAVEEMKRSNERNTLLPQIMEVASVLGRMFGDQEVPEGDYPQESDEDAEPVCNGDRESCSETVLVTAQCDRADAAGSFAEVDPCDIDGHILLLLSLQDLEQESDDLEHENAGLKAQVKALERRLYESRSQEENLRWAVAYRDNPGETEDTPELDSVGAAVALARERYPGQLLFQLNAESNADESSFKWPEQVWNALRWLATDYFTSHLGRNPIGDMDEACRSACGMWYKTSQHENTMTQFRDSYTTWVDGRRIWLGEHIGKGNSFDPRRTIRIAFDWDRQLQKVVIGYIGQHQRTSAA